MHLFHGWTKFRLKSENYTEDYRICLTCNKAQKLYGGWGDDTWEDLSGLPELYDVLRTAFGNPEMETWVKQDVPTYRIVPADRIPAKNDNGEGK